MKWIQQAGIIFAVTFIGEILHKILPLPVPASIYGLLIMLFILKAHILHMEQVRETSDFLLIIMPLLFVPAGVGLMASWVDLKPICLPVILITILTTILVMVTSGLVTQFVIRRQKEIH